jgi:hypothetical protein
MFTNRTAILTVTTVLTSLTAFPQEEYTRFKSEASVQALGSFVKQTTENGIQQGATDSSGVLATYCYYFDRHNGVEVNYGWTSNTQTYNGLGVDSSSNEISAAYVFRMPMKRWSPFVLAGAGALVFGPNNLAGGAAQAGFTTALSNRLGLAQTRIRRPGPRLSTGVGPISISPTISSSELSTADSFTTRQRTIWQVWMD